MKFKIVLYNLIFDIVAFCMIVLIIHKISNINENKIFENPYLDDLIHNWNNKPIKELYIAKNNENCNKYFLNYEWKGINDSCDCKYSNNSSTKGNIYEGKCNLIKTLLGCQTVNKIKSLKSQVWKNSKLCIKELNFNFSESITVVGNKCPKHYILCGTDTKNFSLCFPKAYSCPINYIKFSNSEKKTNEKITHTLKLNEDWYIHYSNKFTNNSIIIDIKYSEGRVCVNPREANIKNTHLKYKKTRDEIETEKFKEKQKLHFYCNTKIGKSNFDERFNHLDSNSKFKFFTENQINNLVEKLPQLNSQDLISQTSNIYYRSYIYWSPFCRENENLNPHSMLNDVLKLILIDSFYPYLEIYLKYIFILKTIILILFWLNFTLNNYNSNNCKNSKRNENYDIKCENINEKEFIDELTHIKINELDNKFPKNLTNIHFILMKLFIFSVTVLISAILFNMFLNEKNNNIHQRFISQKCGDIISNEIFNEIAKHIGEVIINNYQILLISIFLNGLIILKTIIYFKKII